MVLVNLVDIMNGLVFVTNLSVEINMDAGAEPGFQVRGAIFFFFRSKFVEISQNMKIFKNSRRTKYQIKKRSIALN